MVRMPTIVGETWFNSQPLTPLDLRGKVLLIDFWTYSCINCQRTFPYLQKWWRLYKDKQFLIIGIHTPEFDFEKDPRNVERAIKEFDIKWPVVLDNERANWDNFANHFWPAKYVIDVNGRIACAHFGEGGYTETEREIQELIRENLGKISLPEIEPEEHGHRGYCFIPTPELYCGYERGVLSNPEGYHYNQVADYQTPKSVREDSLALEGKFFAHPEYVQPEDLKSTLLLHFRATEVNLVLVPVDKNATVKITLNGGLLPKELFGNDVTDAAEVVVDKPEMYNLLRSTDFQEGVLGVQAKKGKFRAYAFTFSGCVE